MFNNNNNNYLFFGSVRANTSPDLDQEDAGQQEGEGHGHAVILLDGPAAAEEGHEEDDAADDDEHHGGVEELVPEEVEVLAVGGLDHAAGDDQYQTGELKVKNTIFNI